ncbi:MAG: tripartite tricarboxylate transporter substrate binding protein [Betaproteobacteria bacterium]
MLNRGIRIVAACALAAFATLAAAQTYPTKPVRIMVGAGAGGGTDIIARMLAEKYQGVFGQPFVVENKPGASNTIAADLTAKAAPDGHTLLLATNTGQAIAPHLIKLGFDTNKDLIPVALIVVVPNVLVVGPNVPANNVRDLIALIKAKPDAYSYGSSGVGSTQHLAGEAFNLAAGTKAVHVPYKGSSQALADLVGGQIQLDFDTTSSAMSFIKGGKVKALAVMSPKRTPELPDVPTLAEAGLPGVEMTTWYGLFVTAGTPKAVVDRLYAETMKVLALPDVQKRLIGLGGEPGNATPEQFAALVKSDYDRFGRLIKDANVKIEP